MLQQTIDLKKPVPFRSSVSAAERVPLWQSLRNCWLLPPLIYFATNGVLLASGDFGRGSDFSGPSEADTMLSRIEMIAVWFIAVLLMYPYHRRIVKAVVENKLVTALVGYACISALWAPDLADSLRRTVLLSLTACFAYFLSERYRPEDLMRIIYLTGCLAVIGSLLTIVLWPSHGLMTEGEWKGIFGHKNDCGIFLCFLLSPIFFLKRRPSLSKMAGSFCGLLGLVLVAMCQSRGAWVVCAAVICFSLLILLVMRFSQTEAVAISASLVMLAGIFGWLVYENYAAVTYMLGKDPGLTNRAQIWAAVLAGIAKRPWLGYGYGGFWNGLHGESINVITSVGVMISHAHNGYLNLVLQFGLVGLGLFVTVVLVSIKNALVALYVQRSRPAMWYCAILLMTIIGSSDESFLMNYNAITTILFIVAAVGLRKAAQGVEAG